MNAGLPLPVGMTDSELEQEEDAHYEYIGELRDLLSSRIAGALAEIHLAASTLAALRSGDVYDVEFAEGALDVPDHLSDAARSLRAALREVKDVIRRSGSIPAGDG